MTDNSFCLCPSLPIFHKWMHFRETTSLTRAINTFKILSFFSIWAFLFTQRRKKKSFFPPPHLTCLSFAGNSRLASRCLQEGVKLYPLTSGTVSFWTFGFKAVIAFHDREMMSCVHRRRGSNSNSKKKQRPLWAIYLLTNHKTEEQKKKSWNCVTPSLQKNNEAHSLMSHSAVCEHTEPRWLCFSSMFSAAAFASRTASGEPKF